MRYCRNSVFYSQIVPKEDQGGESKRSGVRSVTANFRFTNVNGVWNVQVLKCLHIFYVAPFLVVHPFDVDKYLRYH